MRLTSDETAALLGEMSPITLAEMEQIKLMNRVDTKYIAPAARLGELLRRAAADYRVQEVDGLRMASYDTVYYDTKECLMYVRHHDRQLRRQKIRVRHYVESRLWFLEVKNKTNKGRTKKKRISISADAFWAPTADAACVDFLNQRAWVSPERLLPQVSTRFSRITLVNRQKTERLTIDTDLRFENHQTGITASLPRLMIIELKQDGLCPSAMKEYLMDMHISPAKISKYCIGTVLTNPGVKRNRFKKKLRYIRKVTESFL